MDLSPLAAVVLQISNNTLVTIKICFLIAIILSWFPSSGRPTGLRKFIFQIATPLFRFAARWLPIRIGMIDLSPILLLIGFGLAQHGLIAISMYFRLGTAGWWGV